MRVLWFANTPCNADEYFNSELRGTGGWLKALDIELQEHVELHIAFYSKYNAEPFRYKKTTYYPIFMKKTFLSKTYEWVTNHVIFKEHLDIYLKIIDHVKPDIIHVHGTENPFGYIIEKINVPVVISIQGIITTYYHKYFTGFGRKYLYINNFRNKKLLGILQNYSKKYKFFYKMMIREKEILSRCKYIIGRTDWDYYTTRILAPNSKYYHVDEILRKSFYDNAGKWQPHNRNKLVVFTTTGPSFYKGLETACQALWELQNIGIDVEWRFAGIQESDLIVRVVKKYLGTKYYGKGIKYLGSLNEKELVEQLLDADVYVMPSHIENSPNSLCEAQMLGLPCVATHAGGTKSILNEGNILIQDGDPWAMAGAITNLISKTNLNFKNKIKINEETFKRHDKNKIIKNLVDTYLQIIKNE
ncbi:MAG: hypothetical protein PWR03_2082 [Tenuifilum sp.]|jgi:glycosyltransferase involved in cell wall biosynthesis|uniref:glycosyltransferase family 4 protein n=1 Tax=Tenuifilum sp. TaxID=2760880 RepID=UPI0024ABC68A|nr:glycosyltransferase family 4 protein [Tenuifilum sp.]MDI3527898.1 hypothetical protein [Tenuifilum sp.]